LRDAGVVLHPVLIRAAEGSLPSWGRASPPRIGHMTRVADLLASWGSQLGLDGAELDRWRAAGFLHDALRDAPVESLRPLVPAEWREAPGELLHGPAAAALLQRDGLEDEAFLRAVGYHTVGHPAFDLLGRSLYVADFVEPGRERDPEGKAALRDRMPRDLAAVTRDVARHRIRAVLDRGRALPAETSAFWNAVHGGGNG